MKVDSFSSKGNVFNEDRIYVGDDYVLVLDGASGHDLVGKHKAVSNASWLVDLICNYTSTHLTKALSTSQFIDNLSRHLNQCYLQVGGEFEASASLILARIFDTHIEVSAIGDCTALILTCNGQVINIHDRRVSNMDDQLKSEISKYANDHQLPFLEAKNLHKYRFKQNRKLANTGYSVISNQGYVLKPYVRLEFDLDSVQTVALLSDGAYEYCQPLAIGDNQSLMHIITTGGAQATINTIRRWQSADLSCERYQRFKPYDDATIAAIKIN